MTYIWIAAGGALGSVARYGIATFIARRFGENFPWATLLVNITGSFLIGVFAALSESGGKLSGAVTMQRFLVVGVCGGYTTFSAFSIQTFDLFRSGHALAGGANILLSITLCLAAVWLGYWLGTMARGS